MIITSQKYLQRTISSFSPPESFPKTNLFYTMPLCLFYLIAISPLVAVTQDAGGGGDVWNSPIYGPQIAALPVPGVDSPSPSGSGWESLLGDPQSQDENRVDTTGVGDPAAALALSGANSPGWPMTGLGFVATSDVPASAPDAESNQPSPLGLGNSGNFQLAGTFTPPCSPGDTQKAGRKLRARQANNDNSCPSIQWDVDYETEPPNDMAKRRPNPNPRFTNGKVKILPDGRIDTSKLQRRQCGRLKVTLCCNGPQLGNDVMDCRICEFVDCLLKGGGKKRRGKKPCTHKQ